MVVFDGDDTLWATEALYDRARGRIRKMLCLVGIDGVRWELVERRVDLDRVATQGFAWHRFPRSCMSALAEIAPNLPRPTRWALQWAIFIVAMKVFVESPTLMPGARAILREGARSCDLVLITKGEPWVQHRRIRQSGLQRYFERCVVVPDKTTETFLAAATRGSTDKRLHISVGNSLASDIAPALSAGFVGVHVAGDMWEHERRAANVGITEVVRVVDLRGALTAIRRISAAKTTSLLR